MSTYKLIISIDSSILAFQSTDNLCIAKKVDGAFTTVFQDASVKPKRADQKSLVSSNEFQWTDKYRVFATANYGHGMLVKSVTNNVQISLGDQTTYDKSVFTQAQPASRTEFRNTSGPQSADDSFLANLVPNTLHIAVELEVQGKWAPIYVDPDQHISTMNKQLTPMNEYMLFWDNRVQTSSMIDETKFSFPFIFSFDSGSKTKSVRFGYAVPDQASPNEAAKFYLA